MAAIVRAGSLMKTGPAPRYEFGTTLNKVHCERCGEQRALDGTVWVDRVVTCYACLRDLDLSEGGHGHS